jgi:hypothetical protein
MPKNRQGWGEEPTIGDRIRLRAAAKSYQHDQVRSQNIQAIELHSSIISPAALLDQTF